MSIVNLDLVFGAKPYPRLSDLPPYIKKKPKKQQQKWRSVFNSIMAQHGDESRAFAGANAAIGNKEANHTGVMIALYPQLSVAKKIAVDGGEPIDDLHVTLLFFGEAADKTEGDLQKLDLACDKVASAFAPLKATLGGLGRFYTTDEDGNQAFYTSVDAASLPDLRQVLANSLIGMYANNHGFSPHMTLKYVKENEANPLSKWNPIDISFNALYLMVAGIEKVYPFTGEL